MNTRPSAISGTWYPAEPDSLRSIVTRFLHNVRVEPPHGRLLGIVVPHAGYHFSGQVAAYAFSCIQSLQPDLVVVLGPYHTAHSAPLLTTMYAGYETPLGIVPIDRNSQAHLHQALQERLSRGLFFIDKEEEHAIEIELPFLQHILDKFSLLPVMIRDNRAVVMRALGGALAEIVREKSVLLVASSDLSHFYPQHVARRLDETMLARIAALDPEGVLRVEDEGQGYACGRGAIAAMLWSAQRLGANRAQILCHATSADVNDDRNSVVGYGAAVIFQDEE